MSSIEEEAITLLLILNTNWPISANFRWLLTYNQPTNLYNHTYSEKYISYTVPKIKVITHHNIRVNRLQMFTNTSHAFTNSWIMDLQPVCIIGTHLNFFVSKPTGLHAYNCVCVCFFFISSWVVINFCFGFKFRYIRHKVTAQTTQADQTRINY